MSAEQPPTPDRYLLTDEENAEIFATRLAPRIFGRYLGQVAEVGHGRYTLPEAHDRAYRALASSLPSLHQSGAFDGRIVMVGEARCGCHRRHHHPTDDRCKPSPVRTNHAQQEGAHPKG